MKNKFLRVASFLLVLSAVLPASAQSDRDGLGAGRREFVTSTAELFASLERIDKLKNELFFSAVQIAQGKVGRATAMAGLSNGYRENLFSAQREFEKSGKALTDVRRFALKVYLYKPYYLFSTNAFIYVLEQEVALSIGSASDSKRVAYKDSLNAIKALLQSIESRMIDGSGLLSDEFEGILSSR